jgi:non-ribosomal peptide synthetase component F
MLRTKDKLSYWKNALNGLNNLHLQTDLVSSEKIKKVSLILEDNIITNLQKKFQNYSEYSAYEVLLSSLYALLYLYSGQSDICIGVATPNNQHIPLRIIFPQTVDFAELLHTVTHTEKLVIENELPLNDIINSQPNFIFPFNISISFINLNNKSKTTQQKIDANFSNLFYFDIQIFELINNNYEIEISMNTNLFKSKSIQQFLNRWQMLLNNILFLENTKIIDITLLSAEEKKLIDQLNATDHPPAFPGTVADYFHDIALQKADKTAVVFHHTDKLEKITYDELDEKSSQLANYFTKNLINKHDDSIVIGICLSRSISLINSMIAGFKSGFPILMLETEEDGVLENKLKNHTFGYILVDNITQSLFNNRADLNLNILNIQDENTIAAISQQDTKYYSIAQPNDTIYINYTSGTTGTPKGIMIHQAGLANLLSWLIHYQFSEKIKLVNPEYTTFKAFTPTAPRFDAWYHDCVVPWVAEGGELHMCPDDKRFDPNVISTINKEEKINFCVFTPGLLNQMPTDAEALEFTTTMGAMPDEITMRKFLKPGRVIFNGYGPSEATIIFSINPYQIGQEAAVICTTDNKPVDNMKGYILNPTTRSLCPPGIAGELYITGIGVSIKGYFNQNDLTKKAFPNLLYIDNNYSFVEVNGETPGANKFYATGDYAVYQINNNGLEIKFLGRKDRRLKIHGVLVEEEGIEAKLRDHPNIAEVVIVPIKLLNGEHTLAAYVVCKKAMDNKMLLKSIHLYLNSAFPIIHFPSSVTILEKMPLNKNGKIDKTQLPSPQKPAITQPAKPMEKQLQEYWAKAIGYPQEYLDITTSFTATGGNSLQWVALKGNIRFWLEEFLKTEHKIFQLNNESYLKKWKKEYEEIWPKTWALITIAKSAETLEKFINKCKNDARKDVKSRHHPVMYHGNKMPTQSPNNPLNTKTLNK